MGTNFAQEFGKVFGNSCSISGYDWNKPRYFDSLNSDCYAAEAALMASLASEAYNYYGFDVEYFIKEHDTKFDPLLGEDQLENVKRRFTLKVYTENVPQLQKSYQLQGMLYTEIVTLQCTIAHFQEASRLDFMTNEPTYEVAVPKIGDLMYFKYSDLYYEVLNEKTNAEGTTFLSTPINYTFSLRVWRNSHENIDELKTNDDNMEHLRSYVELGETFNIGMESSQGQETSKVVASGDKLSINDNLKEKPQAQVLYNDNNKGTIRIDPFDGW